MPSEAIIPPEMRGYYDDWRMSPGLASGGFLFLTGMTGVAPDGALSDDPDAQIRTAFANIARVLEEAGLDLGAVVEMTSYHVGLQSHLELFKTIRAELVREPYPAWTAIEVVGLATPGAIVEIRAIARKP